MRNRILRVLLVAVSVACASVVYAHICHSIFRTPRLLAV